jgi:hypothetical protein
MRILRYRRHHHLPVPFVCIEHAPGSAEIIWPKPKSRKDAQLYISRNDHSGREELPVEQWIPEIERIWAKYVAKQLIGGGRK